MAEVAQSKPCISIIDDDLQIIEEGSDSEVESGETSQTASSNTLSSVPVDLASTLKKPAFGAVAITNSENVHFGDKHIKIYNGPINIKQIYHSGSGIDNSSYQKTEVENIANSKQTCKDDKVFQYKLQTWHKLTCSVAGIVLLCSICAVILLVQDDSNQSHQSDHFDSDSNSKHAEVMVVCYDHFRITIISLTVMPITLLMIIYSLTTNKPILAYGDKNKPVETVHHLNSKKVSNLQADQLLISPSHLRIVSRTDWLAQPVEKPLDSNRQPVPWVIITHTATESCHSQSGCVLAVRLMQTFHIESKNWYDIGYNFLVGGDGSAYYGRGWDYVGAHTKFFNKYSISIAFIGTFNKEVPPKQQLDACKKLIKLGVEEGKLAKDYKLFAHRQLMSTLSPGDALFDIIKEWPHFVSNYTSDMIPNY